MTRLQAELHRLYALPATAAPDADAPKPRLVSADGQVRSLCLTLTGRASWDDLSLVWRGVQADLDWPAPAIAVTGVDGHQLWFSLAQAVPAAEGAALLAGLRARYLGNAHPERLRLWPAGDAASLHLATAPELPPAEPAPGRWSAFVAPDLAAVFADEPWLDLPPGADAQADLLAGLRSIAPADWRRAVERLGPRAIVSSPPPGDAAAAAADVSPPGASAALAAPGDEPRQFLLQVMRDPAVPMALRIEAAKALLPR